VWLVRRNKQLLSSKVSFDLLNCNSQPQTTKIVPYELMMIITIKQFIRCHNTAKVRTRMPDALSEFVDVIIVDINEVMRH